MALISAKPSVGMVDKKKSEVEDRASRLSSLCTGSQEAQQLRQSPAVNGLWVDYQAGHPTMEGTIDEVHSALCGARSWPVRSAL